MSEDHAYFTRRAQEHRRLAVEAGSMEAKASHLKLADEYAAKAAGLSGGAEESAEGGGWN